MTLDCRERRAPRASPWSSQGHSWPWHTRTHAHTMHSHMYTHHKHCQRCRKKKRGALAACMACDCIRKLPMSISSCFPTPASPPCPAGMGGRRGRGALLQGLALQALSCKPMQARPGLVLRGRCPAQLVLQRVVPEGERLLAPVAPPRLQVVVHDVVVKVHVRACSRACRAAGQLG